MQYSNICPFSFDSLKKIINFEADYNPRGVRRDLSSSRSHTVLSPQTKELKTWKNLKRKMAQM